MTAQLDDRADDRLDPEDVVDHTRPGAVASWIVLVTGVIGLVAASTLTIERFKLFADPGYRPSCSINPIISCGSVMTTDQAAFFGFPNPIIGIAAFAVVIVAGVLGVARVPIPGWFWAGLTAGTAVGLVFIGYLITQSLYRIGALCPYCMVVWVVTPLLFVTTAQLAAAASGRRSLIEAAGWLRPLLIVAYAVVVAMIAVRFWSYWSTLI
ncbi:vitamin K epoxide reductase family protein [Williamsia deligens]|uniref:Vitamin K epoxide reductase family protein n=1 Tax=Williamsia deligens TaxID=321325 RepID=A0ABW3G5T7_9NOCA|nr:vitamin K epoxide reductase family protein [Williamsia deligens]